MAPTDHAAAVNVDDSPAAVVADGEYAAAPGAYRYSLERFLREDPRLKRWRGATYDTSEATLAAHADLLALLHAEGWNRYGWPTLVGGLGGAELHRAVMYDELAAAGLPIPEQCLTLETLGPALIDFAPSLAQTLLDRYLRGAEWWGQGFSEPEAGSDLASLRCRAVIDGDRLVVTGQKIWTSQGPTATRLLCLVRTGTPEARHHGLTMLLVDVDSPGVTIRPIALASGRRELAEVFFDDVHVPMDRVVGSIDGGWQVAMHLMQWERAMCCYAAMCRVLQGLQVLRDRLLARGSAGSVDVRARLARTYAQVCTAKARCLGSVQALASGGTLGPDSSIDKLLCGQAEQAALDLVAELLPQVLAAPGEDAGFANHWIAEWWYSRAATIMGGSAEIQRQIISDHVLGLPKE